MLLPYTPPPKKKVEKRKQNENQTPYSRAASLCDGKLHQAVQFIMVLPTIL